MAAINAFRRSVVEKLLFSTRPASVAASRPFSTSADRGPDDASASRPDNLSSLISEAVRGLDMMLNKFVDRMKDNSGDAKGPVGQERKDVSKVPVK